MKQHASSALFLILIPLTAILCVAPGFAQQLQPASRSTTSVAPQQGIYLVFPFENSGSASRLDWLREGLEELTIQRLSAAGDQVYTHAGRISELDRSGLPPNARLSRASMIRVAQDLDADFVIFGSFVSDGKTLAVEARILRVSPVTLLPPVHESATLDSLMDLHMHLIWQLISANTPGYAAGFEQFSKAQTSLRLDAFEHYIRGLLASDDDPRLRELREAARLEPEWPDPDFAIGHAYYIRRDCSSAFPWFAKVPKTHHRHLEAVFATGVCRLLQDEPERAEEIFTSLQDALRNNMAWGADLPEIMNNVALAYSRQGKSSEAQADLRRATELDPDEDDYPFNLGLLALRAKEFAAAAQYFRDASERVPDNVEDRAFLIVALERAGKKAEADRERDAANEALGPNALPTIRFDSHGEPQGQSWESFERIKTDWDTTLVQFEMEAPESAAGALPSAATDTPAAHVRRGRQELSVGKIEAAESDFRATLTADSANASAHRGLAEVFRRRGKLDDAVKELQSSLETRDSAAVRTILARIYLEQKKADLARAEVERALKLAPNYADAKQLLEHLQNAKPTGGPQ
jgi:tetratricopeptide (TPR) repeat protein/TolB-like protein